MKWSKLIRRLFLLCFGLLCGCTALQHDPIKLNVPFVGQNPEDCGAATLSMLFEWSGVEVPLAEAESFLFVPALKGTTPELMVEFARQKGLVLNQGCKDWGFIVENLERGIPSIVLFGPSSGEETGHFVVVTGVNRYRNKLRLHDGSLANRWMLKKGFMELWERGLYTVLWPNIPQHVVVSPH